MKKILCAGLIVTDFLIKPVTNRTLQMDTSTAEFVRLNGGGDAYNVATNLASLGAEVSLLGKVGNDELGALLKSRLINHKVDISYLMTTEQPTSASAVLIKDDGERSFVIYKGACHALTEEDIPDNVLAKYDIFYIGSAFDLPLLDGDGMATVFRRAKSKGLTTFLDTTAHPTQSDMNIFSHTLKNTDFFMPSIREATALTGYKESTDIADFLHDVGVKTVVIKMGAEGCFLSSGGRKKHFPAYLAPEVIDTTGAGDAFVSGFMWAFANKLPLDDCAKVANSAGSISIGKIGASATLDNLDTILDRAELRRT